MSDEILDTYYKMIGVNRDIYHLAELFEQKRFEPAELADILASPEFSGGELKIAKHEVQCGESGKKYAVNNNVIDFTATAVENKSEENWSEKNANFLNYHRSLSAYTLINSTPILNYVSRRSGIGSMKDITVVDVGGGTGHALCSFFKYPSTVRYILLDPNVRLMHDQLVRVYPLLMELKMGHIRAFAEKLPFKNESVDVVMSLSSIDHMKSYKDFVKDAKRILKPGGKILISSHLDIAGPAEAKEQSNWVSFLEKATRYLYYKTNKNSADDHTFHFENTQAIATALEEAGFRVEMNETFKRFFLITAIKS